MGIARPSGIISQSASGGLSIVSSQQGVYALPSSATSFSIPITAVGNINNCIVLIDYFVSRGPSLSNESRDMAFEGYLSSTTNLEIEREGLYHSDGVLLVSWQVIEFSGFTSLQKGEFLLSNSISDTATISSVDTNKIMFVYSKKTTSTSDLAEGLVWDIAYVLDGTTIQFESYLNNVDVTFYWYLLEGN